jgi:transforming growth factor-beta-induced protein
MHVLYCSSTIAGPFTLFAPTDAAFRSLPAGALDSLIKNPEELKKVLLTHLVAGTVFSRGLPSGAITVVSGANVKAVVGFSKLNIYHLFLTFTLTCKPIIPINCYP